MRKGIADLHRRAEVSQKANERLLNALASVDDSRGVEELTAEIQKPTQWGGRRVRGLLPWAEDKELITAINHGEFTAPRPSSLPSADAVRRPSVGSSDYCVPTD